MPNLTSQPIGCYSNGCPNQFAEAHDVFFTPIIRDGEAIRLDGALVDGFGREDHLVVGFIVTRGLAQVEYESIFFGYFIDDDSMVLIEDNIAAEPEKEVPDPLPVGFGCCVES